MRIGCGCVRLGSASATTTSREQIRLVHEAIESGVDVFDTADAYGNGASERLLGTALTGRRERVTISTKGGYVFRERSALEQRLRRVAARTVSAVPRAGPTSSGPSPTVEGRTAGAYGAQDFSARHLRSALHTSLRRLQTDHVDVYQLHGPPEQVTDVLSELDDLVREGTVGRFGVGAETVSSAASWAEHPAVGVVQLPVGILDRDAEATIAAADRAHSSGRPEFWARGVLGGGILAAAMFADHADATSDTSPVAGHPKADLVAQLRRIADGAGMALDELAIRWMRHVPDVGVVLFGISSIDHLRRNVALAARGPLPDDVAHAVDRLGRPHTENGR